MRAGASNAGNQAEENKHFAKHNNFTPGLFTVLCEHGMSTVHFSISCAAHGLCLCVGGVPDVTAATLALGSCAPSPPGPLCCAGCFYGAAALTAGEGAYDGFAIMHERMIDGTPHACMWTMAQATRVHATVSHGWVGDRMRRLSGCRVTGPPPRAVYDNGCVLAQYALSRRPEWFWWTRYMRVPCCMMPHTSAVHVEGT